MKLGGPIAGAIWTWFAALPLIGQIIVGAITVAALFYFSRLFQRPQLNRDTLRGYGWNVQQNTTGLGAAIPVIYGENKVFGHVIQQFIDSVNDAEFLHVLLVLSEGEINQVLDIKINDQPVANFINVQTQTRVGTAGQTVIPWFNDARTTFSHGVSLPTDGSSSVYTTTVNVNAFVARVRFAAGMSSASGAPGAAASVVVRVERRVMGVDPYVSLGDVTVAENKPGVNFTRQFREDILPSLNRYDIRVTRVSSIDQAAGFAMTFDSVDEITYGANTYPNIALLGVRVQATDQLSGSPPRISCVVQGRKVRQRSGGAWTAEVYINDVVWCLVDLLTNVRYGLGAYITDADLDIPALESANTYAQESVADPPPATPRFRLNLILDEQQSAWDTVDVILATCRGALVESDNVYRLIIDRPTTVSQVFGNANMVKDSFVNAWVSKRETFTQVEVAFLDKANDYTRETVLFPASVSNPKTKRIQLTGITERAQAVREAKYHMNAMSALSRYVEFDCFLEALAVEVGDIVEVSHDLPQFGFNGRIIAAALVSGSTYDITVDRDDLPAPTAHSMLVRHETDLIETATVSTLTGRVARVVGLTRLPLVRDSLYAYGPTNSTSKKFRVMQITLNPDLTRHIIAMEYDATIYDATGLVLPARSPSLLPNPDAAPNSVTNLTLTERQRALTDGSTASYIEVSWNQPVLGGGSGQYLYARVYASLYQGTNATLLINSAEFHGRSDRYNMLIGPFPSNLSGNGTNVRVYIASVSVNERAQLLSAAAFADIVLNSVPLLSWVEHFNYARDVGHEVDPNNWQVDQLGGNTLEVAQTGQGEVRVQAGATNGMGQQIVSFRVIRHISGRYIRTEWRARIEQVATNSTFVMGLERPVGYVGGSNAVVRKGTNANTIKYATGATETDNIAVDPTVYHAYAIEHDVLTPASRLYVDGVLRATHTANVSSLAAAPFFQIVTNEAVAKGMLVDYCSQQVVP